MTLRRAALVVILSLCGCLHDGLGVPELLDAGVPHDLADPSCTQIASWSGGAPQILGSPTESPFNFVTWGKSFLGSEELSVEIWNRGGTPSTPYSLELPDTNYLLCEVCVLIDLDFNAQQGFGAPAFLAVSGGVTVTRADDNTTHGELTVTGSNLHLLEWDFAGDRPLPHGKCFNIASVSMSGSFSGDGGDPPRWK